MIVQGDHVANVDPADAEAYYPISNIRSGTAAVLVGNRHQLVRLTDLSLSTRVGSIGYYQWNKPVAAPAPPARTTIGMWQVDFRVDGWRRIKRVPAKDERSAKRKAVAQLAREMNRTVPSLNAMIKRGDNSVTITQA